MRTNIKSNEEVLNNMVAVLGGVDVLNKGYYYVVETNKGIFEIYNIGNDAFTIKDNYENYEYEFKAFSNEQLKEEIKEFFNFHKIKVKSISLAG